MATQLTPLLDFIYTAEKERTSLLPLFNYFQQIDVPVRMVKIHHRNLFKGYIRRLASHIVASYDLTLDRVKKAGWTGKTIYVDHGLSPVKYYAYRYSTFHEIDLLFYPGPIFQEIMATINPDFKNGLLGGLPKMDALIKTKLDHNACCSELGLNPDKPVVLFAPTWGGRYSSSWGIENAQYLDGYPNLIISPHPADYHLAKKYQAALPKKPGSTTELIKLADIVVSEVSSIAGEAAIIGKSVVQIELPSYPGCFPVPDKRKVGTWIKPGRLEKFINASNPVKRPFKLAFLDQDWVLGYSSGPENLKKTIDLALADRTGFTREREYWNKQNCYKPDGKTNERLAKMILYFIRTGLVKQLE